MTWRELQPYTLFAAAWVIFTGTVAAFVAPAANDVVAGICWLLVSLGAIGLAFWSFDLAVVHRRRRTAKRHFDRLLTGARSTALDRVLNRLRQVHRAFSPEMLRAEEDRLRRELRGATPSERSAWIRLLSVGGPSGDAWLGLARVLAAQGEEDAAIRCAAEGVRVGVASIADLGFLARGLVGDADAKLLAASGRPAATVALALAAASDPPPDVARVYRYIETCQAPMVVRLVLWQALLGATHDLEEALRQRELLAGPVPPDAELTRWLRDGWAGYLAADDPTGQPMVDDAETWIDHVPARWRAALGLEPWIYVDPPVRYRSSLPVYAVHTGDDLSAMADRILELAAEPVEGRLAADQSPALLASQLRQKLWPRAIRCRATLSETLVLLAKMKSPSHVVWALEVLGEAMGEEVDGRLADLRTELERLARLSPDGGLLARALQAAGVAWAPVDLDRAVSLWDDAVEAVRGRQEGRELYAAFVPVWLTETRRPDIGAHLQPLLTLAVESALVAADATVLLDALVAVSAQPSGRLRDTLRQRIVARAAAAGAATQFLAAWPERNVPALAAAAERLCREDRARWGWTAFALAGVARHGDDRALRPMLDGLRRAGARGDAGAAAAWLVLGYTVDRLDERPGRPEATRALEAVLSLPAEQMPAALSALRLTLERPETGWLEAVEAGLLRRLQTSGKGAQADELRRVEALAAVLPPARLQAHLDRWIAHWSADVTAWSRKVWSELTG